MTRDETPAGLAQTRREWEQEVLQPARAKHPDANTAQGGLGARPEVLYTPLEIDALDYARDLGFPGAYPYTRGIQPGMFRSKFWTMRQYAGFGTAAETNQRFKHLFAAGMAGMNVAFDLPSQLGYDPDHRRARGEVGNVGIACPSLREMQALFDGIPLDRVAPAFAINAPAEIMLSMYIAVGETQGLAPQQLAGSTQNDILKEFIARGNYIFPTAPSLRLAIDLFEYCSRAMPRWNFINICGYHMREAGSTLVQEVAFALGDAITYVEAAVARGLDVDVFAPRLAFNFAVTTNLLEEVAKLRATRRLWARIMKERFGARNPASWMFRTGAGSAGSTLAAQQPENNIVRVTIQALAAVLGGAQSLHTASMDEALALPTEKSATLALRTQQIIAHESGVAEVADPLGGSYYVEALTNQIEEEVGDYLRRIDAAGGMLAAIESEWVQNEIAAQAYRYQQELESGQRVVVGVNRYCTAEPVAIDLHRMAPEVTAELECAVRTLRQSRDQRAVQSALAGLAQSARGRDNLMPAVLEAVKAYATVGEICDVLRDVFGEYRP